MKKYIECEALLKDIEEMLDTAQQHINITGRGRGKTLWDGIYKGINFCKIKLLAAHAADVVEVVRCKDCVCGYKTQNGQIICKFLETGNFIPYVKPNDYCSYGERKEG